MCTHQVHNYSILCACVLHVCNNSREVVGSFYCLILFTVIVELLKIASTRVSTHVILYICIYGNV